MPIKITAHEPPQAALGPALADPEDDWDENDEAEYDGEDEDDADDDIDAKAEEMTRKLNEQILADLSKASGAATTPMKVVPALVLHLLLAPSFFLQ